MEETLVDQLVVPGSTKIVFFIWDGVGGLPSPRTGKSELETARTPNLDDLSRQSCCGLLLPVSWGITPGSGPGHFALFGYDPVEFNVGRGVLEAAGTGFPLTASDVAVRGNFATVDSDGLITDRRAGRLTTAENERLCEKLRSNVQLPEAELFIETVKEHRLLVVFRGSDLEGHVNDTDPQATGKPLLEPKALRSDSSRTADLARSFLEQCRAVLGDEPQANAVTLRGFARYKEIPSMSRRFRVNPICLANYPMYRGVSSLIGMTLHAVLPGPAEQVDALEREYAGYDFFFLHAKDTDKAGEDGNFEAKVAAIEALDALIPRIRALKPEVLIITGDHSTPSVLGSHSWHPVPVLLASPTARPDNVGRLTETACLQGALGQFPATHLMSLALAHAGRLKKFGA